VNTLKDKKILFLSPKFFDYEKEIIIELEKQGANVIFFDERPKNDFTTKLLIRLNFRNIIRKRINSYYSSIINSTLKEDFDYLFIISPETIDVEKIETIKKLHKNIKVYIYLWDSIKNKKNALSLLSASDKFVTFDRSDKNKFKQVKFLPLFYIDDYKNIPHAKNKKLPQYDLSFIGTVHSDRYRTIKNIERLAKENNLNIFYYFYSPSKVLFFFQRLLKKDFRHIDWNDISFISLSKKDVLDIIQNSKVVIDIHHPNQLGLTMRTIEMIGAKKKLLTTNKDVENYNFYNLNNIFFFDRNYPKIDFEFFNNEYQELESELYESYSLTNWIKRIFEVEE